MVMSATRVMKNWFVWRQKRIAWLTLADSLTGACSMPRKPPPGPKTLNEALRAAEYEVHHEECIASREYRRGQMDAIATMQHVVNAAIFQCRMLKQPTPQLEEVREALKSLYESVENGEVLR
jgi:hypothetical protein